MERNCKGDEEVQKERTLVKAVKAEINKEIKQGD
jgi:hypothetical protein